MKNKPQGLLTITEAAKALHVPLTTYWQWLQADKISGPRRQNRYRLYYSEIDIEIVRQEIEANEARNAIGKN